MNFKIGKKKISLDSKKSFVIAEIAQAHDGSLGYAHSFIDIAKSCNVDAIKFQIHSADDESTLDEKFRIKMSSEYNSRYDYWKKMEFKLDQWFELKKHCNENSIEFMVSVFSENAINTAKKLGLNNVKISSGDFFNHSLLDNACASFDNLIISTGMSVENEIISMARKLKKKKNKLAFLQCISKYPCPLDSLCLDSIKIFKDRLNIPIGLSDHSGTIFPAVYAIAHKANLIEVHLCMDKNQYGPDTSSSLTPDELLLVTNFRDSFSIFEKKKNRDSVIKSIDHKELFTRSIALKFDKEKGYILKKSDLTLKKPGTGIPFDEMKFLIGKKLVKNVSKKKLLRYDDLKKNGE